MRNAIDVELEQPVRAAFDGAIDELVVVAGAKPEDAVAAAQRFEAGGDLPARGTVISRVTASWVWSGNEQERRRAVREAVGPVEVAGPHGEIVRIDAVGRRFTRPATVVSTRQASFAVFSHRAGWPSLVATKSCTCRAYSRIMYEPGVHEGITRSRRGSLQPSMVIDTSNRWVCGRVIASA